MVASTYQDLPVSLTDGIRLSNDSRYVVLYSGTLLAHLSAAASVGVEQVFSKGRLVLSHLCNQLKAQSTCALLCLREWSLLGLVEKVDLTAVASLPDAEGEDDLSEGWDIIKKL